MKLTLRYKFILYSVLLLIIVVGTSTYLYVFRDMEQRKAAAEQQTQRLARNIASLQLLDRQDWTVYQNYISQLMKINDDIIFISIYDQRNALRAFSLNFSLLAIDDEFLPRSRQAQIIKQLEAGAVASENKDDFLVQTVDIQSGDRVLGSVHVGFSLIEIRDNLYRDLNLNLAVALIILGVFVMISVYVSSRFTRPLEILNNAMAEVNRGNLNQSVIPTTGDEIAELTITFNSMIRGLKERKIIDELGTEISTVFRFEDLAELVRQRLGSAVNANAVRLYISQRNNPDRFNEITHGAQNAIVNEDIQLSGEHRQFLQNHKTGFRLQHAPVEIQKILNPDNPDVDGLVTPMLLNQQIFGMLLFELPKGKEEFSSSEKHFAVTLTAQAALALENALLYEDTKEKERIKRELEIARDMQRKLLPEKMPQLQDYDVDGICLPANEVGGDYFDLFEMPDQKIGFAIADVCGKGAAASFYMVALKGMLIQLIQEHTSPKDIIIRLNRQIAHLLDANMFITLHFGVLDLKSHTIKLVRAGHNPALHMQGSGKVYEVIPRGIGIGLSSGDLFESTLQEQEIQLNAGESLILYTDGLTEAMNENYEEFGEPRLVGNISDALHAKSAGSIRKKIIQNLADFLKGRDLFDDMTLLIIQRKNKIEQ